MTGMRLPSWAPSFLVLLGMCGVYGFFSTPTPEKVGWAELVIAAALLALVVRPSLLALFDFATTRSVPNIVKLAFFYLLIAPTVTGMIFRQNDPADFIRDFIPLLYFFLPVFLFPMIKRYPERAVKWVTAGLAIAGFGLMLQFLMDPTVDIAQIGIQQVIGENRDNPFQDPTAVFFCALSGSVAVWSLIERKWLLFMAASIGLLLCLAIYVGTVTRAPIGLTLFIMLLTYMAMAKRPWNRVWWATVGLITIVLVLFGLLNSEVIHLAWQMISAKTEASGVLNARDQEALAVLENINDVPILLFGEGWGGLLQNPIFGGAGVRFVHNMFFYFLFKTGIIGFIAFVLYFVWCLRVLFSWYPLLRQRDEAFLVLLASLPPLVVGGILEPMFKALSFGLLLSLFVAMRLMVDKRTESLCSFVFRPGILEGCRELQ